MLELCLDANNLKSGGAAETVPGGGFVGSLQWSVMPGIPSPFCFFPQSYFIFVQISATSPSLGPRARPEEKGKGEIQNGCHL